MAKQYPQRHPNHTKEELSVRFFNSSLPNNWTSYSPEHDYGVDRIVDIFDDTEATGLTLSIQLKSSANSHGEEFEVVTPRVATYNYLNDRLEVVMIVKFIVPEKEAYWILLKDVPPPNQENETFTIRIPKENKLSTISWDDIHDHIREVTDRKLAAQKAFVQAQRAEEQ